MTVVGCINAIGQALPPFIIFNAKNLNLDWTDGEVPGTMYGLIENRWIDMVLFKEWFHRHFLCHAGSNRPLLLLLDGHSSHEAITLARQNDVIIFILVPHTTHKMQPDTAVFGPLKNNWSEACHEYVQSHPGRVITKYQFSKIFSKAWLKSMIPGNITGGFKVCGVYPFNPKVILDHDPCTPLKEKSQQENSNQDSNVIVKNEGSSDDDTVDKLFSPEEEALYTRRYEEGYDVYDARYVSWIQANHPEGNGEKLLNFFPDVTPLDSLPLASVLSTQATTANSESTCLPSMPSGVHLSPIPTGNVNAAAEFNGCSSTIVRNTVCISHNITCTLSSTNISVESAHGSHSLIDTINMSTPGFGSNVSVTPGSTPSRTSNRVYFCVLTPTSSASDGAVHVTSTPESTSLLCWWR